MVLSRVSKPKVVPSSCRGSLQTILGVLARMVDVFLRVGTAAESEHWTRQRVQHGMPGFNVRTTSWRLLPMRHCARISEFSQNPE